MITQQNATYLLYVVCICVVDRQVRTLLKIVRSNIFKVSPMQKCKFQVILSNFDLRTAYPYPLPLLRNVCMQMDTSFIRNPWSMSSKYYQISAKMSKNQSFVEDLFLSNFDFLTNFCPPFYLSGQILYRLWFFSSSPTAFHESNSDQNGC